MSNQDERLGSLLILSDLALILSTYGVLLAFNYFIEPINSNVWIVCTFFVGIKILIVGISDITGIGRYYIVSLLFVLIADVIIFLINQLMAFSLSLRLILLMTAFDMVMVMVAIFIWKRIAKPNFRPIEPEGISWDDEVEPEESRITNQPILETGVTGSEDVFHFDALEPEVEDTVSEEIVEDVNSEPKQESNAVFNFNEITEELPTQEEIEEQLAYDNSMSTELSEFEEALTASTVTEEPVSTATEEEAFSNIGLFTFEEPVTTEEEPKEDISFVTEELPQEQEEPEELPTLDEIVFSTGNEIVEPEASEIEALSENSEVVEEEPVEPEEEPETFIFKQEETQEPEAYSFVENKTPATEAFSFAETQNPEAFSFSQNEVKEPEGVVEATDIEDVTVREPEPVIREEVEPVIETETKTEIPENEDLIWSSIINEALSQEKSEVEVLGEADTVVEEKPVETATSEEDLFTVPLFNEPTTTVTEETPVTMTTAEEVEEEPEEAFFVDTIYDYNEITNSTIGFNKRFTPIPFNVTQEQLDSLITDVKLEMIRFNGNLSKLIEAYNESLPSDKKYQRINDLITLTDQDSISDSDSIIRNKIDLLNQKGFISNNLIHNFIEIINKLNNRVYSIEIAQENLNEKLKLEKEREAEKKRQQKLWEQARSPYSTKRSTGTREVKEAAPEPVLNESEVLLRNNDMDIIIDSADLELLKEFMAQQEKND